MTKADAAQRQQPYLSIVATARNDNHGGDLLPRMQAWIDGIVVQSETFRLSVELILVEWNPPPTAARLKDALSWPAAHEWLTIRIIDVPNEVHRGYRYAQRLPLYQMIAKNVGVRRARGDVVLCTNIDILFSDAVWAWLVRRELDPRVLYRVDRYDVQPDVVAAPSHAVRLARCDDKVVRVNTRFSSRHTRTGECRTIYPESIDEFAGPRRYITPLHFNTCGDFQLMGRGLWQEIRGYPEFEMYSLHIDSLLNLNAHYAGAGEHVLDDRHRIFHIEHGGGWRPEEGETKHFIRTMAQRRIPVLHDDLLQYFNLCVSRARAPWRLNNSVWGLAGAALSEQRVVTATWDVDPRKSELPRAVAAEQRKGLDLTQTSRLFAGYWASRARKALRRFYSRAWLAVSKRTRKPLRVAIFGAGPSGEAIWQKCQREDVDVVFFLDNGPAHGGTFLGLPVFPVTKMAELSAADVDAVILASRGWQREMDRQLRELGCRVPVVY